MIWCLAPTILCVQPFYVGNEGILENESHHGFNEFNEFN